jgi:hypothetical protein
VSGGDPPPQGSRRPGCGEYTGSWGSWGSDKGELDSQSASFRENAHRGPHVPTNHSRDRIHIYDCAVHCEEKGPLWSLPKMAVTPLCPELLRNRCYKPEIDCLNALCAFGYTRSQITLSQL